jgi:acetyltransferase-like isoleucine patch superfamily enzyme
VKIILIFKKVITRLAGIMIFALTNSIDLRYVFPVDLVSQSVERLRATALRLRGAEIGKNSFIRYKSFITDPEKLRIGSHSKIGIRSELFLYDILQIGDNVEIGSDLVVHTSEHIMSDKNYPLCKQGSKYGKVIIGSNVYIGSRVIILCGIHIEDYIVIGAGAVVTEDLKSGFIYAGVPAKPIKRLV